MIGANYRTEVGMVGDARLALEALAVEVRERLAHRPADAVDGSVLAGRAKQARANSWRRWPPAWMRRSVPSAWCSR